MADKQIVPALGLKSFSCPHVNCGANSHQTWFKLYADGYEEGSDPWMPPDTPVGEFGFKVRG